MTLSRAQAVKALLSHTLRTEFRKAHGWIGLALFSLASAYAAYRAVGAHPEAATWNALIWVVLMFSAFNALARPLADDVAAVRRYHMHLIDPRDYFLARMLYHGVLLSALSLIIQSSFSLFLGTEHLGGMRSAWMALGMQTTAWAMAGTITLLGALGARAGAGFGLTAVLGLPLIIPILLLSARLGDAIMSGLGAAEKAESLLFLGTFGGGAAAMGYILFPYLWRE
jgi:heme exporter protein B